MVLGRPNWQSKSKMRIALTALAVALALSLFLAPRIALSQRRPAVSSRTTLSALTITTEPKAIVWLDEIRRGVTDTTGKLTLTKITTGRHTMRVRANGFK